MSFITKLFGDDTSRTLKRQQPRVDAIGALEKEYEALSDSELRAKTDYFKAQLKEGKTLDDILPEAFAVTREAAKRTLSQRHFDVQLIGGMTIHEGNIAEMRTGEGKTLVATLPVYLNALEGKGVHVVTVNDYLSRRDAVWMGQIYAFLGLSVGVINSQNQSYLYDPGHKEVDEERDRQGSFKVVYEFLRPCSKKEAYAADITYGTNNEFGFDYLRDNIAYQKEQLAQRGHHFAIVDEIDSILIDEARTPLIISAPAAESEDLYAKFAGIARSLSIDTHFTIDEKRKAISLTDEGIEKAQELLRVENIYTDAGIKYVHHLETAVRAKALYSKDKEYVVRDGEVVIVDEFTGRLMPGRRWSEGLHQAIEAKEGVSVQRESRTFASITFQNYFRLYNKLSGMTGTAKTSAEEFYKVYGLETITIPTNKPVARIDQNDFIFRTEQGKLKAIARKSKELQEKGQPVLIGTASIEKNELLSGFLRQEGVQHEVLNAKNHEQEGAVIAQAGKKGGVTVATNLAGRGIDIKLGGNPSTQEQYEEVKSLGGLFVLGTERHDARRVDNQLRGRSGRQGDPGETQFFVSLEDSLMRIFATDTIKTMMHKLNMPEDQPIENRLINRSLESAQEKIEGLHFDSRKHVLEYDDVLNQQREAIYSRRRKALLGSVDDVLEDIQALTQDDEALEKAVADKEKALGKEGFANVARRVILQSIDGLWVEHLETMDYLRSSVNLRAYGQRDPLVEYKREGLRLFKDMQESTDDQIRELLPKIQEGAFVREGGPQLTALHKEAQKIATKASSSDGSAKPAPVKKGEKVGRNDPCPCGSGKKYKKCHGLNQ